jgi:hypothetical protein
MNRFVTMAILSLLAASICGQEPVPGKPDLASRPFMRLLETKDGGFLQVLVATYKRGDATATLFGCVHVADRQFYEGMQKRFEACDALLYELIADEDLRPYPGMPRGEDHWISMVQDGMGSGLQLQEQFECMDYRQDNFVHADMTGEQWSEALQEAGKNEFGELFHSAPVETDREAEAKQKPIDLVAAFRSGQGISQLRLMMGRVLCSAEGQAKQPTVLIHGRNERCLEVLQQQLAAGKKQLGIFYGAAHLEHMEQRLLKDLGWSKVSEEWVNAWDCQHRSFPKVEKGLKQKQYRARRDMSKLSEAIKDWCEQHPGETPTWAALRAAHAQKQLPGRADGLDPWGRHYELRILDGGFEVRCLGSDGAADTDDDLVEVARHESSGVFGSILELGRNKAAWELLKAKPAAKVEHPAKQKKSP